MKKIEILWREMLFQAIEKKNFSFQQTHLAKKFGFSISTVFQSLKPLRKMGAVKVTGRGFEVIDFEKVLYFWASVRDYQKDIIYQACNKKPIQEIEAEMPAGVIYGFYSAYRLKYYEVPADYDRVLVYLEKKDDLEEIKRRFPASKGTANLFILQSDRLLTDYGKTTTIGQTWVDLWNESPWYAKEFIKGLKEKISAELI